MLFWRCFAGVLLFLVCLVVLGLADIARAGPLQSSSEIDPHMSVFATCLGVMELEQEYRPELTTDEAVLRCGVVAESVMVNFTEQEKDDSEAVAGDE